MRRAIARGRMLPQSLSTDPRYGRLSLKAQVLYPLMWINCDDQGRLSGDPDEIKYAACPSVRDIAAEEIPGLLQETETAGMIKVYTTSKTKATQMLDWWEVQKLQWAYPSEYPPPEGWRDRLRYHASPKEIVTENWVLPSALPSALPNSLPSGSPEGVVRDSSLDTREDLLKDIIIWGPPITGDPKPRESDHQFILLSFKSMAPLGFDFNESNLSALVTDIIGKSHLAEFPSFPFHKVIETSFGLIQGSSFSNWESLFSHIQSIPGMMQKCIILEPPQYIEEKEEGGKRRGRGRGNLPSALGSTTPSPSLTGPPLLEYFNDVFPKAFGRKPDSRETAQLRDLGKEISSAGGATAEQVYDAFKEACDQNKFSVSYVRVILLDWLGIVRGPPA